MKIMIEELESLEAPSWNFWTISAATWVAIGYVGAVIAFT